MTECWTGKALDWDGYPVGWAEGRSRRWHRWVYQLLVGPIPEGLHLDHLCRNRACFNPALLEPVTCKENIGRGEPANRVVCKNGHSLADAPRYLTGGKYLVRHCRGCAREAMARYTARNRDTINQRKRLVRAAQ